MPPRAFLLLSTESLEMEGIPQASGFKDSKSAWSCNCNMVMTLDLGASPACRYGTNTDFPSSKACNTISRVETSLAGMDKNTAIDVASW